MNKDEKFMTLAIEKARESLRNRGAPFAACIVKNNGVIACAHGKVYKTLDPTAHAEITAIREACGKLKTEDLTGCTVYSTCEPCPMCFSACHWARISKIFYGASLKDSKKAGFKELEIPAAKIKKLGKSTVQVKGGILKTECKRLFKEMRFT